MDEDLRSVDTVQGSDATIADLPTGATLRARITSANAAGESRPGPESVVAVP